MEQTSNIIKEIASYLTANKQTLSVAESCTGGNLSGAFTAIPGASDYFKGSITSYTYDIKSRLLGLSLDDLEKNGAVREEVARSMAEGCRHLMQSTYSLATTGIAGPGGGTLETPIGTVWVAISSEEETIAECLHLQGSRTEIVDSAVRLLINKFEEYLNRKLTD